jgi:mitochondrial enoyl-[acyl-carrier protein] reductase / trans-2-enoyl-CoA reductase
MSSQTLTFTTHSANPAEVVQSHSHDAPSKDSLEATSVLVSFVAAPINPQDIMQIAGKYPVQPAYKHNSQPIPGNDGVAIVVSTGSEVKKLKPGDHVIPKKHGLGTWRRHAVLPEAELLRVPSSLDPVAACLLKMAFAPAYLICEDMRTLKPGDWVAINAAAGTIAGLVVQFAKMKGAGVVAVIREREGGVDKVKAGLSELGADVVVTEGELAEKGASVSALLEEASSKGRVMLALDAVFGESGERLANLLSKDGTYVNYGSLGGPNGTITLTQQLVFWKQIQFRNFRLSQQLALRSDDEQERLLLWFADLIEQGKLKAPKVDLVHWKDGDALGSIATNALSNAAGKTTKKEFIGSKKQVFVMQGNEVVTNGH